MSDDDYSLLIEILLKRGVSGSRLELALPAIFLFEAFMIRLTFW